MPLQKRVDGEAMRRTTVFLPEHLRVELARRGGSAWLRTLIEEAIQNEAENVAYQECESIGDTSNLIG